MIKFNRFFFLLVYLVIFLCFSSCVGCSRSAQRSSLAKNRTVHYVSSSPARTRANNREVKVISKSPVSKKENLSLKDLYMECKNSVFMVYTSNDINSYQGSGFFVTTEGIGVSNYHVFEGTYLKSSYIKTLDGKYLKISKVLSKSKKYDFIIFKVDIESYVIRHSLPISSHKPEIGEAVFAIGNPEGLESTLSSGIVSGYRAQNDYIQTTTEITHGSSGGPLLNMKGQVVGITSAGFEQANLNFAINILRLKLSQYIY